MRSDPSRDGARRRLLRHGAALGLALAAPWPARAAPPLAGVHLRVGSYKGQNPDFFADAGVADTPYHVDVAQFAGGNLIVEAIVGGSVDYGLMSEIPPLFAARAATPLRLIAVLRADVNAQVLLLPQASKATDFGQLKGQRIGYVRSTTSHYFLLKLLAERGWRWDAVQAVALSPSDGLSAFKRGELDAWITYGLTGLAARAQGARVLRTGLGILSGNYVVAAHAQAIDEPARRAAIADYLQRERRAYEWIGAHPEAYVDKLARLTGAPKALLQQQVREQSEPSRLVAANEAAIRSQQAVADGFAQAGVIDGPIDVRPLWDRRFDAVLAS